MSQHYDKRSRRRIISPLTANTPKPKWHLTPNLKYMPKYVPRLPESA